MHPFISCKCSSSRVLSTAALELIRAGHQKWAGVHHRVESCIALVTRCFWLLFLLLLINLNVFPAGGASQRRKRRKIVKPACRRHPRAAGEISKSLIRNVHCNNSVTHSLLEKTPAVCWMKYEKMTVSLPVCEMHESPAGFKSPDSQVTRREHYPFAQRSKWTGRSAIGRTSTHSIYT